MVILEAENAQFFITMKLILIILIVEPNISIIWPQPGPICGGKALVVGKNFTVDTQVLFGANALHSKVTLENIVNQNYLYTV